jgi:hypothetical protein
MERSCEVERETFIGEGERGENAEDVNMPRVES